MNRSIWTQYAAEVMHKCWIALTSGLAVLLLLVVYQQGFNGHVPPAWYWVAASVSIIAALFQSGLVQYKELQPKLDVKDAYHYEHHAPSLTHCYRIPIQNLSKSKTIKNASVRVIRIVPQPPTYTWGKAPLQWTHTLGTSLPITTEKDIKPGDPEDVDFVQMKVGDHFIVINHAAPHISQSLPIPTNNYRITVEAKGEDVPAARAEFEVSVNNGIINCVSLGSY